MNCFKTKFCKGLATTTLMLTAWTMQGATPHTEWKEVWRDDFNGTELNTDFWNIECNTTGGGNHELQYYGPEGISVVDGNLVLTASRTPNSGRQFTSGRLNSRGKVYFTHGKVEARIILPKTKGGLWPAFWMLGDDIATNPWPRSGEIDILEMGNVSGFGGREETYFSGACHWGYYDNNGNYPMYSKATNSAYSLQDGEYHLYTLIWDEEYIRMYLDQDVNPDVKPYYEMKITDYNSDKSVSHYFHKPYHILFDLAVGGYFTSIIDNNKITAEMPAEMKIDWVRICQPEGNDAFTIAPDLPDHSGVANVDSDVSATKGIFSIDGRKLGDSTDFLSSGLYIVDGKKVLIRN